jgi:hypothetical protein
LNPDERLFGIVIVLNIIMGFFKKSALRHRDDKRTRAAELTLRESIYPLCLVTILFFLWVSCHLCRLIKAQL